VFRASHKSTRRGTRIKDTMRFDYFVRAT
jgi:hypothetical protein